MELESSQLFFSSIFTKLQCDCNRM